MKKNLKKIIAVLVVVGTFVTYVFSQKTNSAGPIATNATSTSGDNNTQPSETPTVVTTNPSPTPTPKPKPKPIPTPTPAPKPAGAFTDGTYIGNVEDAYYGNIQVKAVIQNGQLADVIFLQYPSDRSTSVRINSMAMPRLKSEAIQAQSANVNAISGASASSQAFNQSLQSALDQAKA